MNAFTARLFHAAIGVAVLAAALSGTMRANTVTYQSYFSLTTMNYTNGTLVFPSSISQNTKLGDANV